MLIALISPDEMIWRKYHGVTLASSAAFMTVSITAAFFA